MWLKNQNTILQLKNILDEDKYKIGNFVNICKVEFLDFDGNIIETVSFRTFKKYFDKYIEHYSKQEVCEITFTEFKLLQIRFFLQLAYEDILPLRGEIKSKTKGFFVIKYSTGDYFCGNLSFDKQLRKAKIYVWKEKAIEYAEELKTRFRLDGSPYAPSNEYKIVNVEIREVEN